MYIFTIKQPINSNDSISVLHMNKLSHKPDGRKLRWLSYIPYKLFKVFLDGIRLESNKTSQETKDKGEQTCSDSQSWRRRQHCESHRKRPCCSRSVISVDESNCKIASARQCFWAPFLCWRQPQKTKTRDGIEEIVLCCYCSQLVTLILVGGSHICPGHPFLINIETALFIHISVYTVE